tara:strand:- start:42 stop:875 length:834 start_codon:yes stop_codon:yes gene_type:complete
MDLTIVIVSFKSGDILHRCIKSIDKKYPIIIVENSQNIKLKEELEKKYSNVECILPEKNLGYGAGNNLGIKNSKTKYVLTLNPDTILYENTISKLLEQANIIEDFALLGPKVVSETENLSNTESKIKAVNYIKGFAIFFNKEKFINVGFFDENYFLYFEEIDLCKKVIKSNNKIYLINDALIKHIGGKSHEDKYDFEMELSRNWHWMWSSFYYYKKNYNYYYALFKVLKKLISSIIKISFYSLILKRDKRKIYSQRLSGLYNSILGKKSWYRPKFDD